MYRLRIKWQWKATVGFLILCVLASCNPASFKGNEIAHSPSFLQQGSPRKGAMYWPRKAKNPNWWRLWERGDITESDIRADLQQMKHDLGVDAVRVFFFYDIDYRATGKVGFTDGQGTKNDVRRETVSRFIDLAAEEGLYVLPTFFMEMETTAHGGFSWETLESNYHHHEAYAVWLAEMLATKPNVTAINLKNEPDGFGAWSDTVVATRILTWHSKLKATLNAVAPNLQIYINSASFDNVFKNFPDAPEGSQSLYQIGDALAFNHFIWADNGFWPYATPARVFRRVIEKNTLNKPLFLTEFGWPSYHNTDGMIVSGKMWDNPIGSRPTTPSTPHMQKRAVEESVYWAEKYGFDGIMVWSAFDHVSTGYRDPFGLIDENGLSRPGASAFSRAFTNRYSSTGEAPIALADGRVSGGKINGLHGTTEVPGGISLDLGGAYYSEIQRYRSPVVFSLKARQKATPQTDGVIVGIKMEGASGKEFQLRRDEPKKVWRLFINGMLIARTRTDAGLDTSGFQIDFDLRRRDVAFFINGKKMDFFSANKRYTLRLTSGELSASWRLMSSAMSTPVDIIEARAHGEATARFAP